ncbi:MAG: hypothetical protein M3M99_01470, partial [Actinomycetota bacterium]|nr:hypothetical protein [Actinomycetota bacterium]
PFGTAIPIRIGDLIGINCCASTPSFYFRLGGAGAARHWTPPLLDGGGPLAPQDSNMIYELTINADIEPTSAFKLGKPRSSNGKIKIKATLPNPGKLVAGDKGDKKIGDASAAARKLERTKKTVSAPGKVTIKVEPTNVIESQLAGGGAKKVKIKVAFTPLGGEAAVETVKATLRG